jgi:hypothetical protein
MHRETGLAPNPAGKSPEALAHVVVRGIRYVVSRTPDVPLLTWQPVAPHGRELPPDTDLYRVPYIITSAGETRYHQALRYRGLRDEDTVQVSGQDAKTVERGLVHAGSPINWEASMTTGADGSPVLRLTNHDEGDQYGSYVEYMGPGEQTLPPGFHDARTEIG